METITIEQRDNHAEKSLKACIKKLGEIDNYIGQNVVTIKGVDFAPKNSRLSDMRELGDSVSDSRLKTLYEERQTGTAKRLVNAFLKEQTTQA